MTLRSVAVFCGSSSGRDPRYREAAESLAGVMVERGIELVYGGGHVGLMGAVAEGFLKPANRALIASAPDAMSALDHLATATIEYTEKWLEDDER